MFSRKRSFALSSLFLFFDVYFCVICFACHKMLKFWVIYSFFYFEMEIVLVSLFLISFLLKFHFGHRMIPHGVKGLFFCWIATLWSPADFMFFSSLVAACCMSLLINKEARSCAYAHKVPTPLIHILDFIGYQLMKRLKTFKNIHIVQ